MDLSKGANNYFDTIKDHYLSIWKKDPKIYLWEKGPIEKLNHDFKVLEFPPISQNRMWMYCTCCMSDLNDEHPIELHIFSKERDESIIELLTGVAYYHKSSNKIGLWHTINFGRGWQDNSMCEYGLISLPYIYGPILENLYLDRGKQKCIKFYWLVPVTKEEVNYKRDYGIEALEQLFEQQSLNYLDPHRNSVV